MKAFLASDAPVWLGDFRDVHERYTRGSLQSFELDSYRARREGFSQWLTKTQALAGSGEARERKSFRIVHGLPFVLETSEGLRESMTADVSSGGFAGLVVPAPEQGEEFEARIELLDGKAPVAARVAVVAVIRRGGSVRTAFRFTRISADDQQRLEDVLITLGLRQVLD